MALWVSKWFAGQARPGYGWWLHRSLLSSRRIDSDQTRFQRSALLLLSGLFSRPTRPTCPFAVHLWQLQPIHLRKGTTAATDDTVVYSTHVSRDAAFPALSSERAAAKRSPSLRGSVRHSAAPCDAGTPPYPP